VDFGRIWFTAFFFTHYYSYNFNLSLLFALSGCVYLWSFTEMFNVRRSFIVRYLKVLSVFLYFYDNAVFSLFVVVAA